MPKDPAERFEVRRLVAWFDDKFHHEVTANLLYERVTKRLSRTGYPDGLEGDEIPLCGAVVSLADVYDALISKRVYKSALSHEVARGIIVEKRGTQFDPRIVKAFLDIEDEFIRILRFGVLPRQAPVGAAAGEGNGIMRRTV